MLSLETLPSTTEHRRPGTRDRPGPIGCAAEATDAIETLRAELSGTHLPPWVSELTPIDRREHLGMLGEIHRIWLDPLEELGGRERHQDDPGLITLKTRLERWLVADLERRCGSTEQIEPGEAVAAMRRVATRNLLPVVYDWVAEEATWEELVEFLSLEGGPDAGFDDLVAIVQVGIRGIAKVALGLNYWDEMGRGAPQDVHTVLHEDMVAAIEMPQPDPNDAPVSMSERTVLGGLLATNRRLQPEMIGALGLLELQAGPRCRAVLRAMERLDAPPKARHFYEEHAVADPLHGKDWLDRVIDPLATAHAGWSTRMVRGARWRDVVNDGFFEDLRRHFGVPG